MISPAMAADAVLLAVDWPGIILAAATFLTALTAAVVSILGAKDARAAKAQSEATQQTVDGSLTKMLELIKKGAAAEAILENNKLQAVLQAAVDRAVSAEREKGREIASALAAPVIVAAHPDTPTDVRIVDQKDPVPVVLKEKPG